MIEQNGGGHYSNEMFEDAQRCRQEKEERAFLDEFESKYPASASVSMKSTLGAVFGGILGGFLGIFGGVLGVAAGAATGATLGGKWCSIM
ncbi:hypothetical protein QQF64_025743 [Cirrhinus molitorella]|uniref:Uncharacterized protein n=1 Tax=Cirrhinus molitorella TaxID=172907 RepID=A0ABR3NRB4_9TELE